MGGMAEGVESEPMFCGLGVVLVLVGVWDWSSSLTGQGGFYGSMLVRGRRDVIPSILRPDIGALCEEPMLG
jgi:uncharacterized membrane protein YiaA